MTLDELKKRGEASDGEEDQTFFAGGEKSGIAVQGGAAGPSRRVTEGTPGLSLVEDILGKATSPGAASSSNVFSGKPKKLTDSPSDDQEESEEEVDLEPVVRVMIFWRNGYTIGNQGHLRSYTRPADIALLQQIQAGFAPLHLLNVPRGHPVDLQVRREPEMDWDQMEQAKIINEIMDSLDGKEKVVKPFAGAGRRLGDLPPDMPKLEPAKPKTQPNDPAVSEGYDPSKPSTKIQFRTTSGARQIVTFNVDQPISSVIESGERLFGQATILTGRPPISLATMDTSQSIKDAGLEGSLMFVQ